jgi:hypothetical protein
VRAIFFNGLSRSERISVLLEGDEEDSFPPLMVRRVYADFRRVEDYFTTLFDMIVTLFTLPFKSSAVADLRASLRRGNTL